MQLQVARHGSPRLLLMRAAQMAAHQLLGITESVTESVPPVTPHDKSLHAQCDALIKALKLFDQPWATG